MRTRRSSGLNTKVSRTASVLLACTSTLKMTARSLASGSKSMPKSKFQSAPSSICYTNNPEAAFTVRRAISRSRLRTSTGSLPRAAKGPSMYSLKHEGLGLGRMSWRTLAPYQFKTCILGCAWTYIPIHFSTNLLVPTRMYCRATECMCGQVTRYALFLF